MIDQTLAFIVAELNAFFRSQQPSINDEDQVVLASMAPPEGGEPNKAENKVVVSLVNLAKESAAPGNVARRADGTFAQQAPPLYLNVDILVAACYPRNYARALGFLSGVLGFFQSKPTFTPANSAAMPEALKRVTADRVDLTLAEVNNLWAILGARYMPSAVYRLRMLTIDEGRAAGPTPAIGSTGVGVSP